MKLAATLCVSELVQTFKSLGLLKCFCVPLSEGFQNKGCLGMSFSHESLEIAFHAAGEPETFEHACYVLRVALPLGAASPP